MPFSISERGTVEGHPFSTKVAAMKYLFLAVFLAATLHATSARADDGDTCDTLPVALYGL